VIDPQDSARVRAQLAAGEELLWVARPRPADEVRLDLSIWGLPVLWATFIGGMFAFGLYVFVQQRGLAALVDWHDGVPAPLTLSPMLLIGLWLLAAPWVARARSARAIFALSSLRLMRFDGARPTPSKSIAIADLGPIQSDEGADGHGALHIHLRSLATGKGRSISYLRLRGIPDVAQLRRQIAARTLPRHDD
jgi:hypothetical protein